VLQFVGEFCLEDLSEMLQLKGSRVYELVYVYELWHVGLRHLISILACLFHLIAFA